MQWIKCSEKMPTEKEAVLLYHTWKTRKTTGSVMFVGYWCDLNKRWIVDWATMFDGFRCRTVDEYYKVESYVHENTELTKKKVSHWMPLPLPPEE